MCVQTCRANAVSSIPMVIRDAKINLISNVNAGKYTIL